ncbi:Fc.00g017280.m01.CDS01 [Cosmosporella sp. VM-42]
MHSDNAGSRHAHTQSDSRSFQARISANPTPRYSAQSNVTNSVFSRSSTSTGLTAQSSAADDSVEPSSNYRDSFASILDDPFFHRYDPGLDAAEAGSEASEDSSHYHSLDEQGDYEQYHDHESDDNNPDQRWPPPRRESLTVGSSSYWFRGSHTSSDMEGFNIAVIGSTGVGKSSFVQRVLGLTRPPISNASSVRMPVDNQNHIITLLELDLEYFELNPTQPILWPKQVNGHIVPRVDAALILYDVMNQESIRELPQTLAALTNSGLPASLVACKCENPEDDWEVNAEALANHKLFRSCVATYKVSVEKPEIARTCLHTIIRAAIAHRREENGETVSRRRAQSAANLEALDPNGGRPLSQHSKHSRASSDFSLLRGFPNPPPNENYRQQPSRSPRLGQQPSPSNHSIPASESGDQVQPQTVNSMLRTPGIRLDRPNTDSFLDIDESDAESYRYSDDIPILQRNDDNVLDKPAKMAGVSFDDLVDRLLAPRLSRADHNFSDIFLCLYRKFAAPGELFSAILTRLDQVREDKTAHYLSKTATQLRIIEVVAKWVSLYPGDFARPMTRRNLEEFIKHLSTEPIFSIAAQHMRRNLYVNVVEDDDTGWANSDEKGDLIASEILSKEMDEISSGVSALHFDTDVDGRPSGSSETSLAAASMGSHFQFHSYDEYEREAAFLEPTDNLPMNKFRYHIFMDIPDDDVADELTRIDWIMFSSIRIRDFVRHVSLSSAMKEKCTSLRNVNRMINHFNHVAKWVANMILLRDKAKHRAQMLDKFMSIALKLRQLNNYNGLAAILAGINGTAIHRLTQTRSMVPAETQKRFARLVILMGTQKSHFAYRLAWENSPLPRIPFIPLHRRDLVSAEEGSKTFLGPDGDRINWKKFEVLGEVLLPIMKSQGTAYPNLAKHDTARELILGCRMPTDEEDIYQRSVQVESTSGGLAEPSKKKFPWFAK